MCPFFSYESIDLICFHNVFNAYIWSNANLNICLHFLDNDRHSRNRRLNGTLYSEATLISQIISTITPFLHSRPTSVPILKPRVIGTPSHCRTISPQYSECYVYCCSLSVNQRTSFQNNDGVAYTSSLMNNRPQLFIHSVGKINILKMFLHVMWPSIQMYDFICLFNTYFQFGGLELILLFKTVLILFLVNPKSCVKLLDILRPMTFI